MAARVGRVLRQQCQRLYCTSSSLVYKPPAARKSLETQEVVLARNCDSIPGLFRSANSLFSQGFFFFVSFRFLLNISIRYLCNDLFPEMRSLLKKNLDLKAWWCTAQSWSNPRSLKEIQFINRQCMVMIYREYQFQAWNNSFFWLLSQSSVALSY
jgi:hypothetical protein